MKRCNLILFILLLASSLYGFETGVDKLKTGPVNNNIQVNPSKDSVKVSGWKCQSSTSLLLSFSEAFGVGRIYSSSKITQESFLLASGGVGMFGVVGSVFMQTNVFQNKEPVGSFVKFELGVMAVRAKNMSWEELYHKPSVKCAPLVSIGIGKSRRIGNNPYFRYSFDVGYKQSPINFNLTFVF